MALAPWQQISINQQANPSAALDAANNAFSGILSGIQEKKKQAAADAYNNSILQERKRTQDWVEGADSRAKDLRVNRNQDFNNLLSGYIKDRQAGFSYDQGTLDSIMAKVGQMNDAQGNPIDVNSPEGGLLFAKYLQQSRAATVAKPGMILNPSDTSKYLRKEMGNLGYDPSKFKPLISDYMNSTFPKQDSEITKILLGNLGQPPSNMDVMKAFNNQNNRKSGSGSGSNSSANSDSNSRKNQEFLDNWINNKKVNEGSRAFYSFNVGREDLFADDVRKYVSKMTENGVRTPSAIMALEQMVQDNTIPIDISKMSADDIKMMAAKGKQIQDQDGSNNGNGIIGNTSMPDIGSLANADTAAYNTRLQRILSGIGNSGVTPAQRLKILSDPARLAKAGFFPRTKNAVKSNAPATATATPSTLEGIFTNLLKGKSQSGVPVLPKGSTRNTLTFNNKTISEKNADSILNKYDVGTPHMKSTKLLFNAGQAKKPTGVEKERINEALRQKKFSEPKDSDKPIDRYSQKLKMSRIYDLTGTSIRGGRTAFQKSLTDPRQVRAYQIAIHPKTPMKTALQIIQLLKSGGIPRVPVNELEAKGIWDIPSTPGQKNTLFSYPN